MQIEMTSAPILFKMSHTTRLPLSFLCLTPLFCYHDFHHVLKDELYLVALLCHTADMRFVLLRSRCSLGRLRWLLAGLSLSLLLLHTTFLSSDHVCPSPQKKKESAFAELNVGMKEV